MTSSANPPSIVSGGAKKLMQILSWLGTRSATDPEASISGWSWPPSRLPQWLRLT
jgi:hypothetical protein